MGPFLRRWAVGCWLAIALIGCGSSAVPSSSSASGTPVPTAPPTAPPTLEPTATPEATGSCPAAEGSGPAPFAVGGEFGVVPGEGGIDNPPSGLVSLSDWEVTRNGACLAEVLAFQFATATEAEAFARDQAEGVDLVAGDLVGTPIWTSVSGDGARLVIGDTALSISMHEPDPAVLLAMLTSIVLSTTP